MTAPIAAVTGGTGFIGRHAAAALAAAGWRVRLLVRRDPTHPLLAGIPVELVPGDLADEAALSRLVRGAGVVVHAAGAIKARNAAGFHAVNRDATGRLAAIAARDAPGCRFVLISSQAARHPQLSAYAASKRGGEEASVAALGANPWTILRPGIVYGPWDQASAALLRLAAGLVVPVPASPEPRLAIVHVRDVTRAIVACCEATGSGATWELCDASADGHAWRDILRCAVPAPRFVTLPDRAIMAAGVAADVWSALSRRPGLFGRGKAREILHRDWRPDAALRPPATLWRPLVALPDGMAETREWYSRHTP